MKSKYLIVLAAVGLAIAGGLHLNASIAARVFQPEAIAQTTTTRHPAVHTENGVALDGQDVVGWVCL